MVENSNMSPSISSVNSVELKSDLGLFRETVLRLSEFYEREERLNVAANY
jgi:hypothetical protein